MESSLAVRKNAPCASAMNSYWHRHGVHPLDWLALILILVLIIGVGITLVGWLYTTLENLF